MKRDRLVVVVRASLAVCVLSLLAAAGTATAAAVADGVTTTTEASTTAAAPTTTAVLTTAPLSTTVTTAAATTTTATVATKAARKPAAMEPSSPLTYRSLSAGCPVSAVAILLPGRVPGLVGPIAASPGDAAELNSLRYGAVFSADDVRVSGGGCGDGSVPAHVSIASVSLFGGALTADAIGVTVGRRRDRTLAGLRVGNAQARATATGWSPLGDWGEWRSGSPSAATAAALAVRLLRAHAGLPARAVLLVAVAGLPTRRAVAIPARHLRRHREPLGDRPLRITPPLAVSHEIFPVVAPDAAFSDTYGGFRSDVAGNWHHGDDIFAPLGTPVVAVADGTINRVGWNEVGGWRLWVRDGGGDEFYYAHLSGYAPAVLHAHRVHAGEVIGFVGNTGDAFTTSPHLHFEIHPRSLLRLHYNGAVDPTGYLERWTRLHDVRAPEPVHPALPDQPALRAEARDVWRELLVARGLVRRPALTRRPSQTGPMPVFPFELQASAPVASTRGSHASAPWPAVAIAIGFGLALAAVFGYTRRAKETPATPRNR